MRRLLLIFAIPLLAQDLFTGAPVERVQAGVFMVLTAAPERSLLALADPALPTETASASAERGFVFARLPNARLEAKAIQNLFGASE